MAPHQNPRPAQKNIVLCATQRCGSTMVVEDMRNTGVLGRPAELFIPWNPDKGSRTYADVAPLLDRSRTPNGVSAIKVMADQAALVDQCLATCDPDAEGVWPRFLTALRDSAWVWIRRDDVVAQAVSRLMANKTGVHHATHSSEVAHFSDRRAMRGYDTAYNQQVPVTHAEIAHQVAAIGSANSMWRRFFDSAQITPLVLTYEDYAFDESMRHVELIARAAGVTDVVKQSRTMVKVGNERNEQLAAEYLAAHAASNFKLPRAWRRRRRPGPGRAREPQ